MISKDILTILEANGFGVIGTDLFGEKWGPDSVNIQTLVKDSASAESVDKLQYENVAFQILHRGGINESIDVLYDRARLIHVFLVTQPELVTINSTDYLGFEPQSNLAGLGLDKNERYIFSSNYVSFRNPD